IWFLLTFLVVCNKGVWPCNGVPDTGSDISWTYSGSTKVPMGIGGSQYDVQADYNLKSGSSQPAGTIVWWPVTSGPLGTDIHMW
ncbi:MAG: hypothetical protein KGH76_07040, partial [Thaumarchaeota archaeon]|nr:hypothetical protein [Nitrososphaerota archaeon]